MKMGKLSLIEPVDIQNPVKMVGFVLEDDSCEAGDGVSDRWQGCGSELVAEPERGCFRCQSLQSGLVGVFYDDFLTPKHFSSAPGY